MTGERRKRRDNLQDQLGAPVYTGDPLPPYSAVLKDMIFISYRADPAMAQSVLPPGLTAVAGATVTLTFYRLGPGFGLSDCTSGFFAVAVEEYPAPDTSEPGYFVDAVMSEPACRLAARHFGPFRPGGTEVRFEPDGLIHARMWAEDGGEIVSAVLRPCGPLQPQAANDRYIGLDGAGRLVASMATVSGPDRPCEVLSLTLAATAPEPVRRIAPREVLFGIHDPELVFSWSAPQLLEDLAPDGGVRASRTALLDILDRQARACAILSPEARVLHANTEAERLLSRLPAARRDPLRLPDAADQAKFLAGLAKAGLAHTGQVKHGQAGAGAQDRATFHHLLPVMDGAGQLIVNLVPSDPALAGPGAVLALLTDPAETRMARDPGLLELLGLTPAEARIAAVVGAGLPPRAAAQHLGLKESTVRSSLKVIFGKLGVRRQAELVALLAQLGGK